MRFGSQSNRAPGLPVASTAYPATLPAESSGACFRPAAAAKIPASRRFPAPRQPLARLGLSIPAPNQKKPRAARARYVRRPALLRARSDKLLARQSAASSPPRKQNLDPALRPRPLAVRCTPAKPLCPGPPRARRCAPRKMPFPFDGSKFFLGDHEARSGPFIREKFARPYFRWPETSAYLVLFALLLRPAARANFRSVRFARAQAPPQRDWHLV